MFIHTSVLATVTVRLALIVILTSRETLTLEENIEEKKRKELGLLLIKMV